MELESTVHGGGGSEDGDEVMFAAISFSSYLGGSSEERCGVTEISEDKAVPEMVYIDSRSLSEATPWSSGVGVLLKRRENRKGREGDSNAL